MICERKYRYGRMAHQQCPRLLPEMAGFSTCLAQTSRRSACKVGDYVLAVGKLDLTPSGNKPLMGCREEPRIDALKQTIL